MKSNLKLSVENIGNEVYIKTTDNFVCEGFIKSFTDRTIEIKDLKSNNTFTIFIFEIKQFEIIKENKQSGKCQPAAKPITMKESQSYDNPVFGRLNKDEKLLEYFKHNTLDREYFSKKRNNFNVYKCEYVYVDCPNDIYMNGLKCIENVDMVGISFYHNDNNVDKIFKYLTISLPNFNVIVDIDGLSADEFKDKYCELVDLLTNKTHLKLVYGANHIYHAIRTALHVEMDNFIDVQIFYYGLHNIRVAEHFKSSMTYCAMVELLFNVTFQVKTKSYLSSEDILNKIAFNSHFLIPIYQFMSARLLEPIRLLSKRICCLEVDHWDENAVLTDLNLSNHSQINFEMLPRSLQFWSYRDNSSVLQAKKVVDNEMQHEKQAAGGACDVVEINKNLVKRQEMANKDATNYYEEISDDDEGDRIDTRYDDRDDEIRAFNESSRQWRAKTDDYDEIRAYNESSRQWRAKTDEPLDDVSSAPNLSSREEDVEDRASVVVVEKAPVRLGLGRGRGVAKQAVRPPGDRALVDQSSSENVRCNAGVASSVGSNDSDRASVDLGRKAGFGSPSGPAESWRHGSGGAFDHSFSRGRGSSDRARKSTASVSSSCDNARQFATKYKSNADELHDDTEFCEMSVRRWNRNSAGKLCLDQFTTTDENVPSCRHSNESMGTMWNSVALKQAQEIDDLYEQFGL